MYAAFHGLAYRTQEGYGSIVTWEGFFNFFYELEIVWRSSKKWP